MKVVGFTNPETGNKDYRIHHQDEIFVAVKHGTQFRCCGYTGTLKVIKNLIQTQQIKSEVSEPAQPDEQATVTAPGEYDCVHPCALLIRELTAPLSPEIMRTLDCYGWLDDDGDPNYAATAKELQLNIRRGTYR